MRKKFLSMLLMLCMVLGISPETVWAADSGYCKAVDRAEAITIDAKMLDRSCTEAAQKM